MLLAIDTSSQYASVALHDGTRVLGEHSWLAGFEHSRSLLPNIRTLLDQAGVTAQQVTAVVVALGPGSFNGLRVGLSTAKGLAIGLGIPLVGVPTLDLVRAEYGTADLGLNAGRGRIYQLRPDGSIETVPGELPERIHHAGVLAELGNQRLQAGDTLDLATAQPLYVQPPRITPSARHPLPQGANAA